MLFAFAIVLSFAADDGAGIDRRELSNWIAGPGLELGRGEAAANLKAAEKALEATKKGRVNSKLTETKISSIGSRMVVSFPTSKEKDEAIERGKNMVLEAKDRVKNPLPGFPMLTVPKVAVGRIGKLRRVISVGDDHAEGEVFRVVQVIDENNVIVSFADKFLREDVALWLTMPTSGMVDGKSYSTNGWIFETVETKTYGTAAGGTRTLFRLEQRTAQELVEIAGGKE